MNKIIATLTLLITFTVLAENSCMSKTLQEKIHWVASSVTCPEARMTFNECQTWGSHDEQLAAAGIKVCLKEAGILSASDENLLDQMDSRCEQVFMNTQINGYVAALKAFCHFNAAEFINYVATSFNH